MSLLEKVVVTYWKIQGGGLAAPIVMLCHYVGQQVFEEFMDKERWKTYKNQTEWGQLPVCTLEYRKGTIEDDKVILTGSVPSLKSIGGIFGLYFTELKQKFRYEADVWIDVSKDCFKTIYPSFKLKDEEKMKARKELISENGKLFNWFQKFDKKLKIKIENNERFLVDNTVSIADFHFFATINSIICGWLDGIDRTFLKKFEHLHSWYNTFLEHYQKVLKDKPKKEEYPYIVHNGRYYVNGKDQTDFWANKDNYIPEEDVKNMKFSGVGYENSNTETKNMKMTSEKFKELNLDIKKDVQEELEVLTKESTLSEVESASVKILKNTLKKHDVSCKGITEKSDLIQQVKEVLISNSLN